MEEHKNITDIDLHRATGLHLEFLKYINTQSYLKQDYILKRALRRYEIFWLPLAASYRKEVLSAPIDVELIWISHMLNPEAYLQDCVNMVGIHIDHNIRSFKDRQKSLKRTRKIWKASYSSEPFIVSLDTPNQVDADQIENYCDSFPPKLSSGLADMAQRVIQFYYQVSLPHYRDSHFLDTSVEKYEKFLLLKLVHEEVLRASGFDIYLIWRTHQLFPVTYKQDTERLYGKILAHEEMHNEPDAQQSMELKEIWNSVFNEEILTNGVLWRGDPTNGQILKMSSDEMDFLLPKQSLVRLSDINVEGDSIPDGHLRMRFTTFDTFYNKLILTSVTGTTNGWPNAKSKQFWFETMEDKVLCLELYHVTRCGFWLLGTRTLIGCDTIKDFGSKYIVPNSNKDGNTITLVGELKETNIKYEVKAKISPCNKRRCVLYLEAEEYQASDMRSNPSELFGPIYVGAVQHKASQSCITAMHRMKNHFDETIFKCKVSHSVELKMSAIKVFFNGKMTAFAHLIDSDQLPLPQQVSGRYYKCITLKPHEGEKAVIIKNHVGDWGIIFARWKDASLETGKSNKIANKEPIGCLQYKFHKIGDGNPPKTKFGYLKENVFKLESVYMELQKGLVIVETESKEVAENIALAFSLSLLYVLCAPRTTPCIDGISPITDSSEVRGSTSETHHPLPEENAMFVACGLLEDITAHGE